MPIKHLEPRKFSSQTIPRLRKRLRGSKKVKKILYYSISFIVVGLLLGSVVIAGALAWYSKDLPDPNTLMSRDVPQTTKIYDRTGETVLFEIHGDEQRTLVSLSDIPEYAQWASISIEDKDFYNHHGIYWRGIFRAMTLGLLQNQRVQGTSTLTQQFVKNAILTNERSITRKLKEFILSIQIERTFTKDQILQLYMNEIPYGSTYYGIESASQGYFGKSAKDLTLDEAALLAALPQAPGLYSPYGTGSRGDNRELLVGRQHLVLKLMAEQGYISQEDADTATKINTLEKLIPKRVSNIRAAHFVEYIRSELTEKYGQRLVEQGGLKVITTLNWDKQQIAEEEVLRGVDDRGDAYGFSNAALISLDPKTGQILAMVGSKDFFDQENDGQVNVTLRPRQPGSSFKPIVYTAAFLKGYTPEMTLWDVNTVFKTDTGIYTPQNYSLDQNGPISAREALQRSLNTPAVKLLYLVGIPRVLDFAESLGYTTFTDRSRFGLSLVLGGGEVTLLEHARAYSAFAFEGEQMPLASILKVEDANGKVLEEWEKPNPKRIFNADAAHTISNVLTGTSVQLSGRPVAAKTGTTNKYHDAWTMGYTPSVVTGVWVGNNNNDAMYRGAAGATIAAPIFKNYMNRILKDTPVESFPASPPITTAKPILTGKGTETTVRIDTISGKLATEYTPEEYVKEVVFHEAHSELWYIDKNDPLGPAPSSPQSDPQFVNWESAVLDWATKNNWNTTSTVPTEYDTTHTRENRPNISITTPEPNATWHSRNEIVHVQANAVRGVSRIEVKIGSTLIGASNGQQTIPVFIPNGIPVGYYEIIVTAYDDVGNHNEDRRVINLTADNDTNGIGNVTISSPIQGEVITVADFPKDISAQISNPLNIKQITFYFRNTNSGNTRLLANIHNPTESTIVFPWDEVPPSGSYELYPIIQLQSNNSLTGTRIQVTVE
ncbi:MAG: transglycosylase domain-containing protein [bacterium]|nr:transglycosylase domain-containing protein [bacterium]